MKILKSLSLILIVLPFFGCEENDEASPDSKNVYRLAVVKDEADYTHIDSIFYLNNQISSVRSYHYLSGSSGSKKTYQFEHIDNEIHMKEESAKYPFQIFMFENNRLSTIMGVDSETGARNEYLNCHYKNDKLEYLIAYKTDTFFVKYDDAGENIIEIDFKGDTPIALTYDDKNNPYENHLILFRMVDYDEPDLYIDYFNANNILSIDSYKYSYSYNEKNYPIYRDGWGVGDDWRTYFEYTSK